ncbi:M20/M25/M40 family metallo-hydrolase [Paraferrimonas sedimenticola]|uniref:Peptidase M28 n=1 Tax=Paraferrimonas sedimenticola TaxID=375674 RepID=A0AA37W262_9GAMM|nr:M20/M25/M40 family metallo-hydrolase [Paraferrimonas sedimenticola]GLP97407.1 peptidase M28 [Paraferrimonas sedimenticola]
MSRCQLPQLPNWLDAQQLAADAKTLSSGEMLGRKTGTEGANRARNYLIERMQQIGVQPWRGQFLHPFNYPYRFSEYSGINLIGAIPATTPEADLLVVIAHYDHLGNQGRRVYFGADDNASGMAAALAIAQQVIQQEQRNHTVLFLFSDAEERGLKGSKAFVKQWPDLPINLVLNLDMVGRQYGNYRLAVTHSNDPEVKQKLVELRPNSASCFAFGQPRFSTTGSRIDYSRASDHNSFSRYGTPWVYVGGSQQPDWHTFRDTFERLDQEYFERATVTSWQILSLWLD